MKKILDQNQSSNKFTNRPEGSSKTSHSSPGKSVHFVDFSYPYKKPSRESNQHIMKTRGFYMTDTQRKISTPVKVEFNSTPNQTEFNVIGKRQTLFDIFSAGDQNLKILDVDKKVILFKQGITIPDGEEFETLFKARQQTFRKGNRKFTINFLVESTLTIQKLKYKDPIKTFIFENNIWIKSDFFDTKIESSPGYFTLIHPKITNKMDYKEIFKHSLSSITIDANEETVKNGMSHMD